MRKAHTILKEINARKQRAVNELNEIERRFGSDYKDEVIDRMKRAVMETLEEDLAAFADEAEQDMNEFAKAEQERLAGMTISYKNADLVSAINAVRTFGASLPMEITNSIIADFRGNPAASAVLEQIAGEVKSPLLIEMQIHKTTAQDVANRVSDALIYSAHNRRTMLQPIDGEQLFADYDKYCADYGAPEGGN